MEKPDGGDDAIDHTAGGDGVELVVFWKARRDEEGIKTSGIGVVEQVENGLALDAECLDGSTFFFPSEIEKAVEKGAVRAFGRCVDCLLADYTRRFAVGLPAVAVADGHGSKLFAGIEVGTDSVDEGDTGRDPGVSRRHEREGTAGGDTEKAAAVSIHIRTAAEKVEGEDEIFHVAAAHFIEAQPR
jgi:hypothetical protein